MTLADLIRKYLMFWIKAILQECGEGFFTCSEWSPVTNGGAWSSGVSVALEARTSLGSSISRLSSKAGEVLFPEQAGSTEEGFVCQLPKMSQWCQHEEGAHKAEITHMGLGCCCSRWSRSSLPCQELLL